MFEKLICVYCKGETFKIQKRDDCKNCESNGADSRNSEVEDSEYYDTGYVYDSEIIAGLGIERDQVENEGECKLGYAYGNGCYQFTCSSCGKFNDYIYMSES